MGRSAKVHKRIPKQLKSTISSSTRSSQAASASTTAPAPPQSKAQNAKKRADLKAKASKGKKSEKPGDGVLGGADYVSLLMGGRRKAREEAGKLPQDGE